MLRRYDLSRHCGTGVCERRSRASRAQSVTRSSSTSTSIEPISIRFRGAPDEKRVSCSPPSDKITDHKPILRDEPEPGWKRASFSPRVTHLYLVTCSGYSSGIQSTACACRWKWIPAAPKRQNYTGDMHGRWDLRSPAHCGYTTTGHLYSAG